MYAHGCGIGVSRIFSAIADSAACRAAVGGTSRKKAVNCPSSHIHACSKAAASPQASSSRKKSAKLFASGWTKSGAPFIGLTANTVPPKPRAKQKWMPVQRSRAINVHF